MPSLISTVTRNVAREITTSRVIRTFVMRLQELAKFSQHHQKLI